LFLYRVICENPKSRSSAAMVIAIATFHSSQGNDPICCFCKSVHLLTICLYFFCPGMLTQAVNNIVHWHGRLVKHILPFSHVVTIFAGLHLVARDAAFVFAEVLCVLTIISDARALAAIQKRTVISMWPHLLRNAAFGFAFLWVLLSFTTFQEQEHKL
jgi:hypothetical protein